MQDLQWLSDMIATISSTIACHNQLSVTCNECSNSQHGDLVALERAGGDDTPLVDLKFKCSRCGSLDTFALVGGSGHGYASDKLWTRKNY